MNGRELYGNYQFSLTSREQSAIQLWLRFLPQECKNEPIWQFLHSLTYDWHNWTEQPEFERPSKSLEFFVLAQPEELAAV